MRTRCLLSMLVLAILHMESLGQGNPMNPRSRRELREQAVFYAGVDARHVVESACGDEAAFALLSCSQPVSMNLATFSARGGFARIPRLKDLFLMIASPGHGDEVAMFAMWNANTLADPAAFETFSESPMDFAMGLRNLQTATAERKSQSIPALSRLSIDKGKLVWGVVIAGVIGLWVWRKRLRQSNQGPA